jgi:hypothetical protein
MKTNCTPSRKKPRMQGYVTERSEVEAFFKEEIAAARDAASNAFEEQKRSAETERQPVLSPAEIDD